MTCSNEFEQDSVLRCLAVCTNKLPNAEGGNVLRTDWWIFFVLSFFPCCCGKTPPQSNMKGASFHSQPHTTAHHSKETIVAGLRGKGPCILNQDQRAMDASILVLGSLSPHSVQRPPHDGTPLQFREALPTSVNPIKKILHGYSHGPTQPRQFLSETPRCF